MCCSSVREKEVGRRQENWKRDNCRLSGQRRRKLDECTSHGHITTTVEIGIRSRYRRICAGVGGIGLFD